MSRRGLDRRTVLRGMLGGAAVSVGLPWLESMAGVRRAWAADEGFPTRFALFYWGNGNLPGRWVPAATGEGDAWALSDQLAPLARHKDALAVVSGFDLFVPNNAPHHAGLVGILTGAPNPHPDAGSNGAFPGPTLDRWLARELGGDTRFRSIEYGCDRGNSYDGPHQLSPAETSPHALFRRLFGDDFREPGDDVFVDPAWALRRSVLDAVLDDLHRLGGRVSAADRVRLEQHADGIRELERRLLRLEEDPPELAACRRADEPLPSYPDVDGRPQLRERNRVASEIVALAFACDQARVASNWLTRPVSDALFPGASGGHHQLTHDEAMPQPQVHAIVVQVMEALADMIDAFRAIPEGDGTLLDHMALLATSDVSLGQTHALTDFPLLVAGSAGGRLRTDVHVRSPGGQSTSMPTLSIIRALGLPRTASWGAEDNRATDGVAALER